MVIEYRGYTFIFRRDEGWWNYTATYIDSTGHKHSLAANIEYGTNLDAYVMGFVNGRAWHG